MIYKIVIKYCKYIIIKNVPVAIALSKHSKALPSPTVHLYLESHKLDERTNLYLFEFLVQHYQWHVDQLAHHFFLSFPLLAGSTNFHCLILVFYSQHIWQNDRLLCSGCPNIFRFYVCCTWI